LHAEEELTREETAAGATISVSGVNLCEHWFTQMKEGSLTAE